MEEWRPIPEYEGFYEISNLGAVRSVAREVTNKLNRTYRYESQSKSVHKLQNGYWVVSLSKGGVNKTWLIHRLLGLTFIPNPENYAEIDHIDRNQDNNKLENLRWATRSMNSLNRTHTPNPVGKSGERYIVILTNGTYQVRKGECFGTFKTLAEAVAVRNTLD